MNRFIDRALDTSGYDKDDKKTQAKKVQQPTELSNEGYRYSLCACDVVRD
jgi:hypothetical protein